jgi:hypothetical protein
MRSAEARAKAQSDAQANKQDLGQKRLGLSEEKTILNQLSKFDKDPLVQSTARSLTSFRNGLHTLDENNQITTQLLSEIETEIAKGIQGTGALAESRIQKGELKTAQRELAKLGQYASGGIVDLRKLNPEIIKYTRNVLMRLHDAYGTAQYTAAKRIHDSNASSSIPGLLSRSEAKLNTLKPMSWEAYKKTPDYQALSDKKDEHAENAGPSPSLKQEPGLQSGASMMPGANQKQQQVNAEEKELQKKQALMTIEKIKSQNISDDMKNKAIRELIVGAKKDHGIDLEQ